MTSTQTVLEPGANESPGTDATIGRDERELFAADPTCKHCMKPIEKVEDAAVMNWTNGPKLIYHKTECMAAALFAAAGRWTGRRLRVPRR